jgi:hypothetical protein
MNPNNDDQQPAHVGGYVPYFYDSGRFLRYDLPVLQRRPWTYQRQASSYDFSADLPTWQAPQGPQTVEDVISRGYLAVPDADPIAALITDKQHIARLGLDDVISQVRNRYELYHRNMYELNEAVCEANNALFRQLADHGTLVANQRQQYSASKQVQKVYELQREERVNLWRDVSRLRLGLPEIAQAYLSANRKVAAFESGDAP